MDHTPGGYRHGSRAARSLSPRDAGTRRRPRSAARRRAGAGARGERAAEPGRRRPASVAPRARGARRSAPGLRCRGPARRSTARRASARPRARAPVHSRPSAYAPARRGRSRTHGSSRQARMRSKRRGEIVTHDRSIIERRTARLHGPEGLSSRSRESQAALLALVAIAPRPPPRRPTTAGLARDPPLPGSRELGHLVERRPAPSSRTSPRVASSTRAARSRSLRPASNQKLVVALAALDELGPSSKIPTHVLGMGERDQRVWRGSLFLKGFGDPTLSSADLERLAAARHATGIRRITGSVARGRVRVRRRRLGARLEAVVLQARMPAALRADRRPGGRERHARRPIPALEAAKEFKAALRSTGVARHGKGPRGRRARRRRAPDANALPTSQHDRAADEQGERQLLRRDAPEAARIGGDRRQATARRLAV